MKSEAPLSVSRETWAEMAPGQQKECERWLARVATIKERLLEQPLTRVLKETPEGDWQVVFALSARLDSASQNSRQLEMNLPPISQWRRLY